MTKIYGRKVIYKNHQACLVGPSLEINNKQSQYYLELKRIDLLEEHAVRFLLPDYHAVYDLFYQAKLKTFPLSLLGIFKLENTACKLLSGNDHISLSFKGDYAVQSGYKPVVFTNKFQLKNKVFSFPWRMLKAILKLSDLDDAPVLFETDRDDWLFPVLGQPAQLSNSLLTANYISKNIFESTIFKELERFQKDLIHSALPKGRHPGMSDSSPLYASIKNELQSEITPLGTKLDYLMTMIESHEVKSSDDLSKFSRVIFGLKHSMNDLEDNLFQEAYQAYLKNLVDNKQVDHAHQPYIEDDSHFIADNEVDLDEDFYNVNEFPEGEDPCLVSAVSERNISELGLTYNITKALSDAGLHQVSQLKSLSIDDLCQFKGIKLLSAQKIISAIQNN